MLFAAWLARVMMVWAMALLCWPVQGRAQSAPEAPAAVSQASEELAEALREGVAAYDRGDMEAALRAFELVHARAPTARTLRSLGLVAFRQERYDDAVALLEASLASQVRPLTEAQRGGAATVLQEARIRASKAADASAVPPPAPAIPAASTAASPVIEELGPRKTEPARSPALGGTAPSVRDLRGTRLKRAGYALLGVAGAALIASVTSYQVGRARLRRIESACDESGCELDYVRKRERGANLDALVTASWVTAIAAGLSGATGTALLLWSWRSEHNGAVRAELGLGWQGVF